MWLGYFQNLFLLPLCLGFRWWQRDLEDQIQERIEMVESIGVLNVKDPESLIQELESFRDVSVHLEELRLFALDVQHDEDFRGAPYPSILRLHQKEWLREVLKTSRFFDCLIIGDRGLKIAKAFLQFVPVLKCLVHSPRELGDFL